MTRTFVVGEAPAELPKYHQLTRDALARSLEAVRPGVAGKELHRITLEPGCYRPGFGGCRLEDLVLVTEDGGELLTDFPYELEP